MNRTIRDAQKRLNAILDAARAERIARGAKPNPGDHYTECRIKSDFWCDELTEARKNGADADTIRNLTERLEMARNTGD